MIGKGHAIASTGAALDYGWNQEKEAEVVLKEHLAGDNSREIAEEFRIIQSQNERCSKNTLSFIVSPTIEDGKNLSKKDLGELAKRFLKEMKLEKHQSIGFVHRDKAHTHVHIYTNRIGFDGKTYNDSFIGKRSQLAAEEVAKQLGLKRIQEVQQEKLQEVKWQRQAMKQINDRVLESRPKSLNEYMHKMKARQVKVIPSINKSNQLQGFRFEYKGVNLKGSEIHRSMTGGNLTTEITRNAGFRKMTEMPKSLKLMNNTVQLSANMATKIAKSLVKKVIKKNLDAGMGF